MNQVPIVDPRPLRAILALALRQFGTERAAALRLGLSQPTFHRLLKEDRRRIDGDTYLSVTRGVRKLYPGRLAGLRESVLSQDGAEAWGRYKSWVRAEVQRLEPLARPVLAALRESADAQRLFRNFLQRATRGRKTVLALTQQRVLLALYRAVEPLAAGPETWGVERTWQQMHKAGELEPYLRAALTREQIMLNPESDVMRANQCRPPAEYLAERDAEPEEEGPQVEAAAEFSAVAESRAKRVARAKAKRRGQRH